MSSVKSEIYCHAKCVKIYIILVLMKAIYSAFLYFHYRMKWMNSTLVSLKEIKYQKRNLGNCCVDVMVKMISDLDIPSLVRAESYTLAYSTYQLAKRSVLHTMCVLPKKHSSCMIFITFYLYDLRQVQLSGPSTTVSGQQNYNGSNKFAPTKNIFSSFK